MTQDNVHHLPTALDRVMVRLKAALADEEHGFIQSCIALADGRALFKKGDNIGFSKWLDDNNISLSKNERAARIKMGQEPDKLRRVMSTSTRTSGERIYREEWPRSEEGSSANAEQPAKPLRVSAAKAEKADAKFGNKRTAAQAEKADAYLRDLAAKGQSRPSDYKKAAKEVGIGYGTMERALDRERVEREVRAEMEAKVEAAAREAVLDHEAEAVIEALPEPKRMKAKEALDHLKAKLERDNEKLKAKLEADINRRAIAESRAWIDANFWPTWQERVNHADAVLNAAKGVMPSDIFTKFLKVAHPDNSATTETRAEVFRWLNENRKVLIKPEPAAFWPPMPKDREEMEQWKQHGMPKQPRNEAERKAYDAFVENLRREREKKAGREAKRTAKAKGETDAAQ